MLALSAIFRLTSTLGVYVFARIALTYSINVSCLGSTCSWAVYLMP